jgi:hypothetical protein
VLVITSTEPRFSDEQQQDMATSETLKGAEAAAVKEQQKASEIMAERLPGLADPNAPADQQPYKQVTPPASVGATPQPLHPDRFTPGATSTPSAEPEDSAPAAKPSKPAAKPEHPGRNP